jgi:segregation and condensation protein B
VREPAEIKRLLEAILFAADAPVSEAELQARLPGSAPVAGLLAELAGDYAERGVRLERQEQRWAFRTAPDLAPHLASLRMQERRLSKAAVETLAVIAYRQPVTRAEIEAVRGVAVAKGTLDLLLEQAWIAPRGRKEAPGRPVTWVTTPGFLDAFALTSLDDLPRADELDGASIFQAAAND